MLIKNMQISTLSQNLTNRYYNQVNPYQNSYETNKEENFDYSINIDASSVVENAIKSVKEPYRVEAHITLNELASKGATNFIRENNISEPSQIQAIESLFTNLQSAITESSLKSLAQSRLQRLKEIKESYNPQDLKQQFNIIVKNSLKPLDIKI